MALAAPASAQAADGVIDGSPLNVYANDVGRLQAGFDGVASGEFYTGALMPNDGGISVAVQAVGANAFTVYGRAGGRTLTPVSAPVVTGNGSAGTPWRLTTAFRATDPATGGDLLDVSEVLEYVNGTGDLTVTYTLSAPTALSNVRLYHSASVLPASSYLATGFLQPGPPRRVGAQALGRDSGGSDSLVEVTPWSAFQEATASVISNTISAVSPAAPGFNNTVDATRTGNGAGMGAQWNLGSLASPATVAVTWHFSRTSSLALAVPSVAQTTGQTVQVPVTARNNDGGPDAGLSVRYTITGVNPGSGAVTTGADGTALITWLGAKTGTDTLTAFVDRDGNGIWDVNTEPRQIVTVTFAPLPPPVPGKSVNVQVVSGKVLIRRPGSGRARQAGPAKGFVPLTGAANVPVGSQLDTSKGRVALTSAADTGGAKTQTVGLLPGHLRGQAERSEEEAQEAQGARHRPRDEGRDRALAVRAAEGRAVGGGRRHEEEGTQVGPREAVGQRQGQVPHGRQVQRRDRARHHLAGAGPLRRDVDQGHPRDGPGARLQAQEDDHGQGRPQLPRAGPTGGKQGQAAVIERRTASSGAVTPRTWPGG